MKYYIATSLRRADHNKRVQKGLTPYGYEITYDWTKHGSVKHVSRERLQDVAIQEVNAVLEADIIIVLLPGGLGTHTEFGIALGLGKKVIIHAEDQSFFDIGDKTVAFYHHPNLIQISCAIEDLPERIHESLKELSLATTTGAQTESTT